MRAQLAAPNSHVVGPETYNELFTMHGTTMIFLFNTPVLAGFGNYLIPLQLGTRDMAFPAPERLQLLGLSAGRASSCTPATWSGTHPTEAGLRTCR